MENKLPKNWVETELDSLFSLAYGKGLSVKELLPDGEYNVYGANSIIGKYNAFNQEKSKVIISCRGAASGAIHKTIPKSFVTSNSIVLDAYSDELLLPDYVKYFMTSADKTEVITGTAQPQITIQLLKNLSFCFPPLAEQQRIVTKLDELFGHLDSLKTRLNHIPQILKNFRQAVLTQAVTGKLTEEWRVGKDLDATIDCENLNINSSNVDKKGWVVSNIHEYLTNLDSSRIPLSQTVRRGRQGKYPYYGATGIIDSIDGYTHDGEFILISEDGKNLIYRTKPIAFLAKGKIWVNNHAHVLQVKKGFRNLFAIYFFNSIDLTDYITGIDQLKLSQKNLNLIPINIPSAIEQTEIVKRVEHLFTKADAIEAQYQSLKTKIDSLPQAILAKAFKGELVAQLDTDGSAAVLLEEIQKLKAEVLGKQKKSRKK